MQMPVEPASIRKSMQRRWLSRSRPPRSSKVVGATGNTPLSAGRGGIDQKRGRSERCSTTTARVRAGGRSSCRSTWARGGAPGTVIDMAGSARRTSIWLPPITVPVLLSRASSAPITRPKESKVCAKSSSVNPFGRFATNTLPRKLCFLMSAFRCARMHLPAAMRTLAVSGGDATLLLLVHRHATIELRSAHPPPSTDQPCTPRPVLELWRHQGHRPCVPRRSRRSSLPSTRGEMSEDGVKRSADSAGIPAPPHPERRREPLPWHSPKPVEEDPGAADRIQAILKSRAYREADEDIDFLRRSETRGVRLQLDYLKAEVLLEEAGIEHTVVVFGGTRIREPAAAQRAVSSLEKACVADPGNAELRRRLEIARRILAKSRYYEIAREFGRIVGAAGSDGPHRRVVVMTGGGPGIMEAANRGSYDIGAESIGLNITLPESQYPNPYVSPGLCFRFHYFANRKLHFMLRARALVAFPGGFGTLDEIFEILTLVQTRKIMPVPIVLVGEAYWRKVIDFEFLAEEGTIDPEDRELFWFAETADEIWSGILRWYEAAGRPLFPASAAQET